MSRVVVAPDSFKGTASAADAADAIARGWRSVRLDDEVVLRPMADGGEGTLDAFAEAVPGAERRPVTVTGPDGRTVEAAWVRLPDGTGVVELAATSGITLLDPLLPLDAHTTGFGQAIAAALDDGVERLLLALGGSASTDGGAGALAALGAVFLDAHGRPLADGYGDPGNGDPGNGDLGDRDLGTRGFGDRGLGNRGLGDLRRVDLAGLRPLPRGGATILGDVTNPLLGPTGAAAVFGPQKGADAATVAVLDRHLECLVDALPGGAALAATEGAGAAGGTGFGLLVWGARMSGGAAAVADAIGLDAALAGADLVITGEGRYDGQSEAGKAPVEVAVRAARAGVPVALVAGLIDADVAAFEASVSLTGLAGGTEAAMADPLRWLEAAGAALAHA